MRLKLQQKVRVVPIEKKIIKKNLRITLPILDQISKMNPIKIITKIMKTQKIKEEGFRRHQLDRKNQKTMKKKENL